MAAINVLPLWNFNDPVASEARFRELAKTASPDDAAILQTQIARSWGLRRRFDQARTELAALQPQLATLGPEARVRYQLELGRSWVSATHQKEELTEAARDTARQAYRAAYELARQHGLDYLAIDALHMLPFVDTDADSTLKWTKQALELTTASSDADAKKWESMLRNNYGYSLHTQGRLAQALVEFQLNVPVTERLGNAAKTRIAHWMVAWTLRGLGRLDEALAIQLRLEQENARDGTPDVYVFEELAALHRERGDAEQAAHYARLQAQHQPK